MFSAVRRTLIVAPSEARGMATLNELKKRIASTKNIRKITSSMKMVSAAKMRGDEARLRAGKLFGNSMVSVYGAREVSAAEDEERVEEIEVAKSQKRVLLLAVSSDRGLCGGVNSAVTRRVRAEIENLTRAGHAVELRVVGDKGRAQLQRFFPELVTDVFDDFWKNPLNLCTAGAIAEHMCAHNHDELRVVHNVFKSAIAYDTVVKVVPKFASYTDIRTDEDMPDDQLSFQSGLRHLEAYEMEPDDNEAHVNMYEFSMASTLFGGFLDSLAAEQAARMTAMDNASNNAGDMIGRLTLKYNRLRQAKITTELIEIISGAESLKTAD